MTSETSCTARSPPQYAPAPSWLLTFWPWSRYGSRMWPGVPLCKVSSSYRPFGFRVRADVRDIRQTNRRTTDADDRLMPPPPTGRGHNNISHEHWTVLQRILNIDSFIVFGSYLWVSPGLWNQLPDSFRQPHQSCLDSPPHPLLNPSLSSSPLSSSITPSLFHSRLKTYLFNKSFPP